MSYIHALPLHRHGHDSLADLMDVAMLVGGGLHLWRPCTLCLVLIHACIWHEMPGTGKCPCASCCAKAPASIT